MFSYASLIAYWVGDVLLANLLVFFTLFGALLLGLLVGYERSFHGRAAGMRTYGLVCMASAALTVIGGYHAFWYGGHGAGAAAPDVTHIIQGIVTGIGFLGAGVIMREGFNISGLTTAASIWAASVIGVLIGVGFYAAAILLSLLSATCMVWISRLEAWLPSRHAAALTLRFAQGVVPDAQTLRNATKECGYQLAGGSISIVIENHCEEWHFVAVAFSKQSGAPFNEMAHKLAAIPGVEGVHLSHARN
jgi:putative Mg2+ transporter-C (MgtC) family protein